MKLERHGTYWLASGQGPQRPILVEANTRAAAAHQWHRIALTQLQRKYRNGIQRI